MIELNQIWVVILGVFALAGAIMTALFAFYYILKKNQTEGAIYVPVSAFKAYLELQEEVENFEECTRIKNLIKGKKDSDDVLLPDGYYRAEAIFYTKELEMKSKTIVFKEGTL